MVVAALDRDTQAFLLDASRLQQFVQYLEDEPGSRVRLERLWSLLANVYGNFPFGPERRLWLMVVLQELASRGEICAPGSTWASMGPNEFTLTSQSCDKTHRATFTIIDGLAHVPLASTATVGFGKAKSFQTAIQVSRTCECGVGRGVV